MKERSVMVEQYIKEVSFTGLSSVEQLQEKMLLDLPVQKGFVLQNKQGVPFYALRKLEVFSKAGNSIVSEKHDRFIIIDAFDFLLWEGNAENCIIFLRGLTGEDVPF